MKKRFISYIPLIFGCFGCCFTGGVFAEGYAVNYHFNVYADYLYMKRSKIHSHAIVNDQNKPPCDPRCPTCNPLCPDFVVLTTKKLVQAFDYESGYRVGGTFMPNKRYAFEGNYMWLDEWESSKTKKGHRSLRFPFDDPSFAHDFVDADKARAKYTSQIWGSEVNMWRIFTPRRGDYFSVSGIFGFRYFNLRETFNIDFTRGRNQSSYNIHTKNDLGGAQFGLNLQVNPTWLLVWEFTAKIGGFLNFARDEVFLGDYNNTVTLRKNRQKCFNGSLMTDLAASLGFQFFSWFNVHVGYQFIYLNGLALAPEQIEKKPKTRGQHVYVDGDIYIYGAFAGLIVSF